MAAAFVPSWLRSKSLNELQQEHRDVSKQTVAFTTKKGPTARSRAKRKAAEAPVIKTVRKQCERRDGYCRVSKAPVAVVGDCAGVSEWAHFGEKKRARTRGQAPEVRHDRQHSFMACHAHHTRYDAGEIQLDATTKRGCDGRLKYTTESGTFTEAA